MKTLEIEVLALKRQYDAVVQQLAALTLELRKRNSSPHCEESSSGVSPRVEGYGEVNGEVIPRSEMIDFSSFQGEDPLGWLYKAS